MNRRNFFKVITGFVAGVFAATIPKTKSDWKVEVAPYDGRGNSDEIQLNLGCKEFQDALAEVVKDKLECGGQNDNLKAEYCKAHPFCRGCHFNGKKCLLHEIDWDVFQKVMLNYI